MGKIAENLIKCGENLGIQRTAAAMIEKGLELGLVQATTDRDPATLPQIRDNQGPILRHWA